MVVTPTFGFLESPSVIDVIYHTTYINVKPMRVCKLVNLEPSTNSHIFSHGIFGNQQHARRMYISYSKNQLIIFSRGDGISNIIKYGASNQTRSTFLTISFKVPKLFIPLTDYILLGVSLPFSTSIVKSSNETLPPTPFNLISS